MSEMTADETFNLFTKQWVQKDPAFHLDDPQVRNDLMTLVSVSMSLLAAAPPAVWQEFMKTCAGTAKQMVPPAVQERIKSVVSSS